MLLIHGYLFALLSGVAVMSSPSQYAAPGGIVVRSEPAATPYHIPRDESIKLEQLEERQFFRPGGAQPAQHIIGACPEVFRPNHDAVLHCSSCGGENLADPGYCVEKNLGNRFANVRSQQITLALSTNNGQGQNGITTSLVTVTTNGETATGTFELDTLTQFSGLRQSITAITTVAATTTTSGGTGLETAVVIVLAGGVAWFLADIGGSAAIGKLIPDPEIPEDRQDDKTCPDPKVQCKDCDGYGQMCTTGKNPGCACEEDTCPADESDEQPGCEDDTCAGQNGKCTTGEHNGCNCSPLECPETQFFWCSDCGGADEAGKCRGDPNFQNALKTCECRADPDWSTTLAPLRRHDIEAHQKKLLNLPPIVYEPELAPSKPYPKCDTSQISGVRSSAFTKGTYNAFCDAIKNGDKSKPLTQLVDIHGAVVTASKRSLNLFRRSPPVNLDLYKDYKFALGWTGGDGSCSSDCADSFLSVTGTSCGSTAGDQNIMVTEASLDTGCGTYSWKVIKPGELSTPTKPKTTKTCADPTVYTRFSLEQAEDAIKDFCTADISLPKAAQPVKKTYPLKEFQLQLSTQWSQTGQNGCNEAEINPVSSTLTAAECSQYFLSAVNECNTDTRTDKFGSKPLIWNSPRGCIDFYIYGDGPE